MAIEKEIGRTIVKLRKQKKLRQEDLAGLAEIDRNYLSEIENGYKNITVQIHQKEKCSFISKLCWLNTIENPMPVRLAIEPLPG